MTFWRERLVLMFFFLCLKEPWTLHSYPCSRQWCERSISLTWCVIIINYCYHHPSCFTITVVRQEISTVCSSVIFWEVIWVFLTGGPWSPCALFTPPLDTCCGYMRPGQNLGLLFVSCKLFTVCMYVCMVSSMHLYMLRCQMVRMSHWHQCVRILDVLTGYYCFPSCWLPSPGTELTRRIVPCMHSIEREREGGRELTVDNWHLK